MSIERTANQLKPPSLTTTEELFSREHTALFQTYKRLPVAIDRAEGCKIFDVDGKCYLDMLAGIAVNALGHSHPRIVSAVIDQAKKYMHVSNFFYQEPQVTLAEMIKSESGLDRVFFTNSGAEALEGALKLVRKWGNARGKTKFIAFSGGFHGRTIGALSLMDKPLYKDGMGPWLPNCDILPYNNSEALRKACDHSTCAILLELIQGEGGVTVATQEFVETIEELRSKLGILLIVDEVQTGFGRTGKFFAFQSYDQFQRCLPDIIMLGKGIGGGLPLGAIAAKEEISNVWQKGNHGTTYGGNAIACVAGIAVVEELRERVIDNVSTVGEYFRAQLELIQFDFKCVKEIRGRGLFLGIALSFPADELVQALLEKRIIANSTSGNVLRLVPPLIITREEVDEFLEGLRECLPAFQDSSVAT